MAATDRVFDPRADEAERIRTYAADEQLEIHYLEQPLALHHYTIVGNYRGHTRTLAQRLTAQEALAFLEGYSLGRRATKERVVR